MIENSGTPNWWKRICLTGIVVALLGGIGVLLAADAAVSAVVPHGTGSKTALFLVAASVFAFGLGSIASLIAGFGWMKRALGSRDIRSGKPATQAGDSANPQ